jgi:hypothetical protein
LAATLATVCKSSKVHAPSMFFAGYMRVRVKLPTRSSHC